MVRPTLCLAILMTAFLARAPAAPTMTAPPEGADPLVIIVNKANPVDNVSYSELRQIFMAERIRWANGAKVTVVMREPGQTERESALRLIYRMTESDLTRYFLHATYRGSPMATPKQISTTGGMRKFVFNVPGAIGYVRAGEADDSVKVLRVDGRAPGDAGYRLHL